MHNDARRLAILAEGTLDFHHGKTATSILRYRPRDVAAVIDSTRAGMTTAQAVGLAGDTPIVSDITEALAFEPSALLLGTAPRGGALPPEWRRQLVIAIEHGLDVVSGLHFMLNDDAALTRAAEAAGVRLIDVRRAPADLPVATLEPHRLGSHVVTFVGSDCATGKMTAALEVNRAAEEMGLASAFVATGQTGIMLAGDGIAIDNVVGDFMAGSIEQLVVDAAQRADWVFVEGQGSLLHPGYSGVTLALLHGSSPDGMILVHRAGQTHIHHYPLALPDLPRLIHIYEEAAGWIKPAKVVGIALNTQALGETEAREAISLAAEQTGLIVTDPVRYGGQPLVQACRTLLGAPAYTA